MLKLSILDQAPISTGKTAQEALQTSVKLSQLGEKLGYHRFWISEHHDLNGHACPNPNVMLGVIGAQTNKIRIGAGVVLLPYYKPFRVAETYNLLATLFPERIDIGLGRAPGGSAEAPLALTDNYLKQVKKYPEKIDELINFLHKQFPEDHSYRKISPTPVPKTSPQTWLLGTSEKSALLAAEKGLSYGIVHHYVPNFNGPKIVKAYRENFRNKYNSPSQVVVTINTICAETTEKAEDLALSYLLWMIQQGKGIDHPTVPSIKEAKNYSFSEKELKKLEKLKDTMIIGDPYVVKEKITALQQEYEADEMMIITITHDEEAKFNSYRLIKEQFS